MRLLFVADVVGAEAAAWLISVLPAVRRQFQVDVTVVNPDNTAISGPRALTGSGVDVGLVEELFAAGADVISPGTHLFDGPDHERLLSLPGVIRAANLPAGTPGRGVIELLAGTERIAIAQLAEVGASLVSSSTYPAPVCSAWNAWPGLPHRQATVVHLVAERTHAARVFAHAVDGQAAAVLGTLSHIASHDLEILPCGTGLVPDVGYTGPSGGIGGFEPDQFIAELRGNDLSGCEPYRLAGGPLRLGAVIVEITRGRTRAIERLEVADFETASQIQTMTSSQGEP